MLTDNDRDELLIRIDERVDELRRDMKHAKGDKGFARCQVHTTKMNAIQNSLKWSKRTIIGGSIAVALKFIYEQITKGVV